VHKIALQIEKSVHLLHGVPQIRALQTHRAVRCRWPGQWHSFAHGVVEAPGRGLRVKPWDRMRRHWSCVVALLLLLLSGYTSAQSPRRRSGTGHGPAAGSPGALQAALVLPQVSLSAAPTHGAQLLPRTVSALRALLDEDGAHREALRVLGELYQVCLMGAPLCVMTK